MLHQVLLPVFSSRPDVKVELTSNYERTVYFYHKKKLKGLKGVSGSSGITCVSNGGGMPHQILFSGEYFSAR